MSLMAEPKPSSQSNTTHCTAQVQHVTKSSSDKLLLKFADPDSPTQNPNHCKLPLTIRRKSSRRVASGLSVREMASGSDEWKKLKRRRSGGSVEWRAGLLLPVTSREKKGNGGLIRRIGIGRMDDKAVGIGLILAALERTWQKTVASASKVFVEKHRTDHVRLISDMV